MSLWSRSWVWVLRRVLVEVRGLRRATERVADALELQGQGTGAGTAGYATRAQVFRGHSRTRGEASEGDLRALTEVSYVDERELAQAYDKEAELTVLLGRAPSAGELDRALRGEVE